VWIEGFWNTNRRGAVLAQRFEGQNDIAEVVLKLVEDVQMGRLHHYVLRGFEVSVRDET
jgi:hypothetical protein